MNRVEQPTLVRGASAADFVALVKPRILVFALFTAAGGMSLAPGVASLSQWLTMVFATALIVGGANTLNMYLERETDCLMARTKNRPLPTGRIDPCTALAFGLAQVFLSVPILTFAINPLTGLLGVIALLSYVLLYTPLKQRTALATLIGAVPGATPALMGWTAATSSIDAAGLTLFGVLFLWQIPHFHAIALFRHKDYARAGLKTLPSERGELVTRHSIVLYTAAQVLLSLQLFHLGVSGMWYLATATLAGGAYFFYALLGLRASSGPRWARRLFLASIAYLPLLFAVLILDGISRG